MALLSAAVSQLPVIMGTASFQYCFIEMETGPVACCFCVWYASHKKRKANAVAVMLLQAIILQTDTAVYCLALQSSTASVRTRTPNSKASQMAGRLTCRNALK